MKARVAASALSAAFLGTLFSGCQINLGGSSFQNVFTQVSYKVSTVKICARVVQGTVPGKERELSGPGLVNLHAIENGGPDFIEAEHEVEVGAANTEDVGTLSDGTVIKGGKTGTAACVDFEITKGEGPQADGQMSLSYRSDGQDPAEVKNISIEFRGDYIPGRFVYFKAPNIAYVEFNLNNSDVDPKMDFHVLRDLLKKPLRKTAADEQIQRLMGGGVDAEYSGSKSIQRDPSESTRGAAAGVQAL